MKKYGKLVRDNIPAIIEADGGKPVTRVLDEAAYIDALLEKLLEEAREVRDARGDAGELSKELADVYEVIDAIVTACSLDKRGIADIQAKRQAARGGFEKRIYLESVT